VTLTGSGFVPTTVVSFSGTGVTVKSRTYVSETQLTLMVSVDATAAVGDRTVTVTNPDGGVATRAAAFMVTPAPTISTVSPSSLRRGQTTTFDVVGTNYVAGASVTIAGSGITSITTKRIDATRLRATVAIASSAPTGARNLTVRNGDAGIATKTNAVTIT
jgi:hypothetical protein